MTNKELLDLFDDFSERLLLVLADSDRVKQVVVGLLEENARLRLENRKLQELLLEPEPAPTGRTQQQGRHHLEAVYNEGFHVCNDFYGQARGSSEDCLICMELLYGDLG